jgi:hypothetical protein
MKQLYYSFLTILSLNVFSQDTHIQTFSHVANTQIIGESFPYTFYYIVDSSVSYKRGNNTFYQFTFSEDSSDHTDFISYDKKQGNILLIADTSDNSKTAVQIMFQLKNNYILKPGDFPCLGSNITMRKTTKGDTIKFSVKYFLEPSAHSVYITEIEFIKGEVYPESITFHFPFESPGLLKISGSAAIK